MSEIKKYLKVTHRLTEFRGINCCISVMNKLDPKTQLSVTTQNVASSTVGLLNAASRGFSTQ